MRDGLALLLIALAGSAFAWVFFHYLGRDAWSLLIAIVAMALAISNIRLRKKLKAMQDKA